MYALATAAVQVAYMLLVGTFPFNSFLAGVLCSLSFFSLTGARAAAVGGRSRVAAGPGKVMQSATCLRPCWQLQLWHSRWLRSLVPRALFSHPHPPQHQPHITVCLRMQIDPSNKDFSGISPERAFADYVLANAVLFLAVWNYMG